MSDSLLCRDERDYGKKVAVAAGTGVFAVGGEMKNMEKCRPKRSSKHGRFENTTVTAITWKTIRR